MSLTKKPITVHFFSIEADEDVVKKFVGAFNSIIKLGRGTDVVNLAQSRYLLKCKADNSQPLLSWYAIKERNTWQVRSKHDGSLGALQDSNSIIGDASFYKFNPNLKILAAFTTYSAKGYLKAMCNSVFERLLPRSAPFKIDYLFDNQQVSQIKKWDYYSKISIKLDTTDISDQDEKPDLINALLSIKDSFGGSTISVTLDGGKEKLPKQDVTDTISYLSSSDSCESLYLAGGMFDGDERTLPINLKKAFVKYRTTLELRADQKYIHPADADRILAEAFSRTSLPLSNS